MAASKAERARAHPFPNPWRGLGALPAQAWILFATTLVNRAGTMALPFLALYLTRYLGESEREAGFALTCFGVGALVSAPLAGLLSDRFGATRVMQLALAASGTALFVLPLARSVALVFALTALWAAFGEAVRPASLAAMTMAVREDQRRVAFALNRLAINLGMSIGPAVGGILATVSFPLLFIVDGATSLAAAALLTVLARTLPVAHVHSRPINRQALRELFANRRLALFLAGVLLVHVLYVQLNSALPLYVVDTLGLSTTFFGLLFVVNTALIIVLELPLNIRTAEWPYRVTLCLGAILIAAAWGGMALAAGALGVVAMIVVFTFGEMISSPASASYVAELAPPGRSGAYMGLYTFTYALSIVVGAPLGTVGFAALGPRLWALLAAIGVVATGLFLAATRPVVRQKAELLTTNH
jgi:predicted MFS family arabinose efflux permease